MRTIGTFQDVYRTARDYYNDENVDDCPMDPVVRRVDTEWMLESGINPSSDADYECSLADVFDTYFWEAYKDADWIPTDEDADEFVRLMSDN
jgi:hypothetical protein